MSPSAFAQREPTVRVAYLNWNASRPLYTNTPLFADLDEVEARAETPITHPMVCLDLSDSANFCDRCWKGYIQHPELPATAFVLIGDCPHDPEPYLHPEGQPNQAVRALLDAAGERGLHTIKGDLAVLLQDRRGPYDRPLDYPLLDITVSHDRPMRHAVLTWVATMHDHPDGRIYLVDDAGDVAARAALAQGDGDGDGDGEYEQHGDGDSESESENEA